jgi:hypothetical protein
MAARGSESPLGDDAWEPPPANTAPVTAARIKAIHNALLGNFIFFLLYVVKLLQSPTL